MTPTMRTLLVLALTAAVTLPVPLSAGASRPPRFAWPLAPPHQVVRAFEPPATEYAAGHRGVDLAAPPGTRILAAADAVVLHAGPVADRTVVSLLHPGGLRTTYEPVAPTVQRGQQVRRGTQIGTLTPGHEGCPTTACLHWGAVRPTPPHSRTYLNPLHLLTNGRVRLLPKRDDLTDHHTDNLARPPHPSRSPTTAGHQPRQPAGPHASRTYGPRSAGPPANAPTSAPPTDPAHHPSTRQPCPRPEHQTAFPPSGVPVAPNAAAGPEVLARRVICRALGRR